jgi:hypothetical protein
VFFVLEINGVKMSKDFFPERPDSNPQIYAYQEVINPNYKGLLKIGYTTKDVEHRVEQQYPTKRPGSQKPYKIVFSKSAMRNDGSTFSDKAIHKKLRERNIECVGGEWFRCSVEDLQATYLAVRDNIENIQNRIYDFKMRPEQEEAVSKTIEYFRSAEKEKKRVGKPKFLWNAKMRFGKTFATYKLAQKMGMKKVLILTFKPAVQSAWEEDIKTHLDFEGWQFISKDAIYGVSTGLTYENADKTKPIVCFGSFQDFLGVNENGGIKAKNEWVHEINWDLVCFDEYHYGAWRDKAKKLFEQDEEGDIDFDLEDYKETEAINAIDETFLPITCDKYLFLSGTPFRALNTGEFIEEQIYNNWTYADEQYAKENWSGQGENPYLPLPRVVLMTYKIPDAITEIASQGEFNEFDLNVFFSAEGKGENNENLCNNG